MLDRLERSFGKFAIPNLTMILIALIGAVSAYGIAFKVPYVPLSLDLIGTPDWWQIAIFPFRLADRWIGLLFTLYMLWYFGSALEADMGEFRYNVFILLGILTGTAAVLLLPYYVEPPWRGYLYIAVFLAVAYRSPDTELLIFFILPVKLKWLALLAIGLMLFSALVIARQAGSFWPLLSPVVSLLNLILFFGPEILQTARLRSRSATARSRFRGPESTVHRCAVCGLTERENPLMDFRYCAQCADHEYCADHLNNHEHVNS